MDRRFHPDLFPLGIGVISARFRALSFAANFRVTTTLFKDTTASLESSSSGGAGRRALGRLSACSLSGCICDGVTTRPVCRSRPEACRHDHHGWNATIVRNFPSSTYGSHPHYPGTNSTFQDIEEFAL